MAYEADKVILDNTQRPSKPNLSEVDNAEMEQFIEAIRLIMSSIGGVDILESQKVLHEKKKPKAERIFEFRTKM